MKRFATILVLLSAATACGGDNGTTELPETLCTAGETRCFGNYVGTCAGDGKQWAFDACWPNGYCNAGQCTLRTCTPPGEGQCQDEQTVSQCNELGSARTLENCGGGDVCVGGTCVPFDCDTGRQICVFRTILTCSNGGWNQAPCVEGKACLDDDCAPIICTPDEARCSGEGFAGVCNPQGTEWVATECKDTEHCVGGFCLPLLKTPPVTGDAGPDGATGDDVPQADEGGVDVRPDLPAPDAYTPGVNQALIQGVTVKFDSDRSSIWVAKEETLGISLESKVRDDVPLPNMTALGANIRIEIYLSPLPGVSDEGGPTGDFSCGATEGTLARLWLRYGKHGNVSGDDPCKDFDYQGLACVVSIDGFGPVGGTIVGRFGQITMEDCKKDGSIVTISDGQFDVLR